MSNVRLICGNCAQEKTFTSYEEAAQTGWDPPDRYGYTACEKCPGVSVYFPMLTLQQAREAQMANEDPEKIAGLLETAAMYTIQFQPRVPRLEARLDDLIAKHKNADPAVQSFIQELEKVRQSSR